MLIDFLKGEGNKAIIKLYGLLNLICNIIRITFKKSSKKKLRTNTYHMVNDPAK